MRLVKIMKWEIGVVGHGFWSLEFYEPLKNSPWLVGHTVREKCPRNDWFNNGCKTGIVTDSFNYVLKL